MNPEQAKNPKGDMAESGHMMGVNHVPHADPSLDAPLDRRLKKEERVMKK